MNRKQLETLVIFFGSRNKASNTAVAASLMTYKNKKHENIINKTFIFFFFRNSPSTLLRKFWLDFYTEAKAEVLPASAGVTSQEKREFCLVLRSGTWCMVSSGFSNVAEPEPVKVRRAHVPDGWNLEGVLDCSISLNDCKEVGWHTCGLTAGLIKHLFFKSLSQRQVFVYLTPSAQSLAAVTATHLFRSPRGKTLLLLIVSAAYGIHKLNSLCRCVPDCLYSRKNNMRDSGTVYM